MVREYEYINIQKSTVDFAEYPVIIWGISISALWSLTELTAEGAEVIAFTDSYQKTRGIFAGLPIIPYSEIKNQGMKAYLYVSTDNHASKRAILETIEGNENVITLIKGEVHGAELYDIEQMKGSIKEQEKTICEVRSSLSDTESKNVFNALLEYRTTNDAHLLEGIFETGHRQYFPPVGGAIIPKLEDEEVFVDAGAYNGETSCQFAKWCSGKYKWIYILEPDDLMYRIANEYTKMKKLARYKIYPYGAYSSTASLPFISRSRTGASYVSVGGQDAKQSKRRR